MGLTGNASSVIYTAEDPRRLVVEVLVENDGVIWQTAHALGVSRPTLYKAIRRFHLWPAVTRIRREVALRRKR